MAESKPITLLRDAKDYPTTMTLSAFPSFLRLFRAAIDAEMRIDHSNVDPFSEHFASDLRHAEILRERLIERCFDLLEIVPELPGDKGLMRLAFLLKTMFATTDDDDRRDLFARVREHRDLFMATPSDPFQHGIYGMQMEFFTIFSQMETLREYSGPGYEPAMLATVDPIPA
jgi:hypothetical protein